MKTKIFTFVAISSILFVLRSGAEDGVVHRWDRFPIGSWASYRTTRLDGRGEIFSRFKLLATNATTATVEMELDIPGLQPISTNVEYHLPEKSAQKYDRVWEETLEISDWRLKCKVMESASEGTKFWNCDEVPGLMVRIASKSTITTLVDFKKL